MPTQKSKVKAAKRRSLESALRDERTAITAIVKVMLIEVPDSTRALARIDAMARAAQGRKYSPGMRRALLDAALFVRRAIELERGKQQSLLDPPRPEPNQRIVGDLLRATDGPQQLGLANHESILGDVEEAHEDRVRTIGAVHAAIVGILRDGIAATDRELFARYSQMNAEGALPRQSQKAITERRRELMAAGRIALAGRHPDGSPRWDVVEREQIEDRG